MSVLSHILRNLNNINRLNIRNYYAVIKQDQKEVWEPLRKAQIQRLQSTVSTAEISSKNKAPPISEDPTHNLSSDKQPKMSKAMKLYLERGKQYDAFMKTELEEYENGRRHLANMMGEDPETFTQEDIDHAIEYLMPSGLYEPGARPMFKHPTKILAKRKAAEFDIAGRPFHCMFYTGIPNFYQILHDTTEKLINLNKYEDTMITSGLLHPDPSNKINLNGTRYVTKLELEKTIIETVKDKHYDQFLMCMERLAVHPYSSKEKEFILKFSVPLVAQTLTMEIPQLKYDENKRPYMDATGYRKRTVASVTVRGNGSGKMYINGMDITFFDEVQDREQLMFPIHFSGLLNKVDVEAQVVGVGHTAQSGAIRHGISLALRSFVSKEMVERMRLAGLLTRDPRTRERKKTGQEGARRKYTWKKR